MKFTDKPTWTFCTRKPITSSARTVLRCWKMPHSTVTKRSWPNAERKLPACRSKPKKNVRPKPAAVNWRNKIKIITQRKEPHMNDKNKTPEFLKGSTVDEHGLPLRMKI